jgi:hypothetical protein
MLGKHLFLASQRFAEEMLMVKALSLSQKFVEIGMKSSYIGLVAIRSVISKAYMGNHG